MHDLPNIEKSAFVRGAYVGYGGGTVFRITRSNSSYGTWCARDMHNDRTPLVFAFRLSDMGAKLAALRA